MWFDESESLPPHTLKLLYLQTDFGARILESYFFKLIAKNIFETKRSSTLQCFENQYDHWSRPKMKSYILRQPKKFNRSKTAGELSQYKKVQHRNTWT